jgi:hypothetical protein
MSDFISVCRTKACGWNSFKSTLGCSSGDGSCLAATFISADESEFHTAELIAATDQINNALASIARRDDKKLAVIDTTFGLMLAWVDHDTEIPPEAINVKSPPEEIIKALGLQGVKPDREQAY